MRLARCGGVRVGGQGGCAPERPCVAIDTDADGRALCACMEKGRAGVLVGACRMVSNGVGHWLGPPKPYLP